MLRIRLSRGGKTNNPVYKVVVAERQRPVKGKFVESLGIYNPLSKYMQVDVDRVKYWISVGAQPTDTMHNLLVKNNIIEGKSIPVHRVKVAKSDK